MSYVLLFGLIAAVFWADYHWRRGVFRALAIVVAATPLLFSMNQGPAVHGAFASREAIPPGANGRPRDGYEVGVMNMKLNVERHLRESLAFSTICFTWLSLTPYVPRRRRPASEG